jgi:hypothetical protein
VGGVNDRSAQLSEKALPIDAPLVWTMTFRRLFHLRDTVLEVLDNR